MTLRLGWQPVTHGGRTPLVTCETCRARIVNESNAMHRAKWEQARTSRGLIFRCGQCASRPDVEVPALACRPGVPSRRETHTPAHPDSR